MPERFDNGTIDVSGIADLQGVVDPAFRFYFYENRIGAGSADRRFGITSLIIKGAATPVTPAIFSSVEYVNGEMTVLVSNMAVHALSSLQATESLIVTNWITIATTSGVADVEWVLPTTNPASFFRVISE